MKMLPSGWRVAPLAEIADVTMGQSPPGSSYNSTGEGVPFFQGKSEFTDLHPVVRKYTTAGAKFAKAGDVLLSVRAPVGPTNVAGVDCAIGRGLASIRARPGIDQRYLLWVIRATVDDLAAQSTGSTFGAVSGRQVRSHRVPVASVTDQRRIVEILEDHLSRLDVAEQLVSGAERRLGSWQKVLLDRIIWANASAAGSLRDLVDRIEAGKSFGGSAPPAREDQWGVIKVSAMTWGQFKPEENKAVLGDRVDPRCTIRAGDLLVSRANTTEYVGAPVLVSSTPPRLLLSDKSLRLVPRADVDPRWLVQVLAAPSTRRQISERATGTKDSMRNISQASLLRIGVPRATPAEQSRAVSLAESVGAASATVRTELEKAKVAASHLRRALLAVAFAGRLTGEKLSDDVGQEWAGV